MRVGAVWCVWLALVGGASAWTFIPCCNVTRVAVAVTNTSNDGLVLLGPGTFTGDVTLSLGGAGRTIVLSGSLGSDGTPNTTIQSTNRPAFQLTQETPSDALMNINLMAVLGGLNLIGIVANRSNVVLTNVSMTSWPRNAIYWQGGSLTLNGGTFSLNGVADGTGSSAVNSTNGNLTVSNTVFTKNAGNIGGAIMATSTSGAYPTVDISGSTFTLNAAYADGAAIHLDVSRASVRNCIFTLQTVAQSGTGGGALSVMTGLLTLTDSTFRNTKAYGAQGGALVVGAQAVVTAVGLTLVNNTGNDCGGIYIFSGGNLTVDQSMFINNSAISYVPVGTSRSAGAIRFLQPRGPAVITNSIFIQNSGASAGAIAYGDDSDNIGVTISIDNCTFISNGVVTNAPGAGALGIIAQSFANISRSIFIRNRGMVYGAIFAHGDISNLGITSTLFVVGCNFTANNITSLTGGGGAIYTIMTGLSITDTYMAGNYGNDGGAIRIAPITSAVKSYLNITRSRFVGNSGYGSGPNGGVIYTSFLVNIFLWDSIFDANSVGPAQSGYCFGGAIYTQTQGVLVARNTTFTNNIAYRSGGAIHITGSAATAITITDCTFASNTAFNTQNVGGALSTLLSNAIGSATIVRTTFTNNAAPLGDGGAIYIYTTGVVAIQDSAFISNTGRSIGAINICGSGGVDISRSNFTNNYATFATALSGGAVRCVGLGCNVTDSVFLGNGLNRLNTGLGGGAVSFEYGAPHFITRCTFVNNFSNGTAGAFYCASTGSSCSISDSTFTGNVAAFNGGAIASNDLVVAIRTTFVNNSCGFIFGYGQGGGVYTTKFIGSDVLFQSNSIPCQSTSPWGAGLVVAGGYANITRGKFYYNTITNTSGGACNVIGAGMGCYLIQLPVTLVTVIDSCDFVGHNAYEGGGLFINMGTITVSYTLIRNCTFRANTALSGGGGLSVHQPVSAQAVTVLENCLFIDNQGSTYGAGAIVQGGALTVRGSTFTNNSLATGFGGGLSGASLSGTPLVVNTTFFNNAAVYSGAAIITNVPYYIFANCSFVNNRASINGGALQSTNQQLTITGSIFEGNTANYGGGLCYSATNGAANISSTTFLRNVALTIGGGIWAEGNMTTTGCALKNNQAPSGGGIYLQYPGLPYTLIDSGSTFVGNTATDSGGGIATEQPVYLRNSRFVGNVARTGAGVFVTGNQGRLVATGAQFISNVASGEGGGLYAVTGEVFLYGATFQSNSASSGGGLMAYPTAGTFSINGSNFLYNHADLGGGLAVAPNAQASLTGSMMIGNDASDQGGGIYVDVLATLRVFNSTLKGNRAVNGGGGGCWTFVSTGSIVSSIISDNYADMGGGLYLAEAGQATMILTGLTMNNNSATENGGAIYSATDTSIVGSTFTSNRALKTGGAIFSSGTMSISGTTLTANTAVDSSAGIYCLQCSLTIAGLTAVNNTAYAFPVFSCALGSSMSITNPVTLGQNPIIGSPDDQLIVDCVHCGCCQEPADALIDVTPCWPYPRGDMACDYSCAEGFAPANPSLTCLTNGAISGSIPACRALPCIHPTNLPALPPHMHVTSGNVTYYQGDPITLACDTGYQFTDVVLSVTMGCTAPTWATVPYACQPQLCRPPLIIDPASGVLSSTGGGAYGDIVFITCNSGYHTSVNNMTCTAGPTDYDAAWVPSQLSCTPDQCPELPISTDPTAPVVGYPNGNSTGAVAIFRCLQDSSQLDPPNANLTCNGFAWVSPPGQNAVCAALPCPTLPPLPNGRLVYTIRPTALNLTRIARAGDSVNAICDPGFAPVDLTLVEKTCNGQGNADPTWSSPQDFACAVTSCSLTRDTTYTSCENRSDIAVNATCALGCLPGSAGSQLIQVTCLQTQDNALAVWQPPEPNCYECDTSGFSAGNALTCTTCPAAGITSGQGATLQSNCSCLANTAEVTPGQGDCGPCPDGAVCAGGRDPPISKAGYFKNNGQFVLCTPEEACAGADNCTQGYTGFLCGGCDEHYYRLNGRCVACPNDIWWRILVAVVVALGLAYGLVVIVKPSAVSERSYGFASANIAVSFIQIVATFADLRVPWPAKTRELFSVFSTLNLNIELAGPECFATFTFWQKFQLQMSIPLIAAGLLAVLWVGWVLVSWILEKRPPWKLFKRTVISIGKVFVGAYLFFLMVAYLLLAKAALSVFACRKHPDGQYTIAEATAEFCFKDQWGPNAVIGGIGIAVYVVGIPFTMEFVYYRIRARYGSHVAVRSLYANFLVKKFTNERWYWEAVIMLRKLTVVLVATLFFGDPYIQVALCSGVFFLVCVATLVLKPYRWAKHNLLEIVSLVGSLVVLFCGQMSASPLYGPIQQEVIGGVAIFTVTVCLFLFAACFALESGIFLTIQRLQKKLNADGVLKVPSTTSAPVAVLVDTTRDHVIVVGQDGVVRGHELKDVNPVLAFDVGYRVRTAAMYRAWLAVSNGDTIELWDLDTRSCVASGSTGQNSPINVLAASPRGLATGHDNGGVAMWAFEKPVALRETRPADSSQFGSLSAADLTLMLDDDEGGGASTSGSASMASMTAMSGKLVLITDVRNCEGHNRSVTCICITSWFVYSASTDARVKKWNALEGQQLREWTVTGLQEPTAIEENGTHLVVGDISGTLFLIDVAGLEVTRSIRAQTARITRLVARGGSFASSSTDGTVVLWDSQDGGYQQTLAQETTGACGVALVRDSGSRDLAFWADALGVLRQKEIQVAWHVHDFDPQLATRVWNSFLVRVCGIVKGGFGKDMTADDDSLLYEELHVISRDLGVTKSDRSAVKSIDDLSNDGMNRRGEFGAERWAQLGRAGAASLTEALVEQSAERDGRTSRKLL